jgi:IclR family transcriptional regulator, KDG regulon repressor
VKKQLRSPKRKQADKNYIGVTAKIFALLEYFIEQGAKQQPISFLEISSALPFARTTVHRILYSLEKLGYVEKAEVKAHYRLGPKFFELTEPAVHFRRLQSVAKAVMMDLLVRYSETVNLGVLDEGQVAYIEVLQSPSALRIAANPGDRNPVHSTALGKVILAYLPDEEVETIIERHPMIRMTPKTITQKAHFIQHLASVREQGVAFDVGENVDGVVCVAAPIFDQHGRVVAGLSLSGPASRMEAKLSPVRDDVRNAGLKVSRMLGPFSLREEKSGKGLSPAIGESLSPLPASGANLH